MMGSVAHARAPPRAPPGPGRATGMVSSSEEVHAAFGQALRLLAVGRDRLVEGDVAEGLERLAQRADRARHQGAALRPPRGRCARPRG